MNSLIINTANKVLEVVLSCNNQVFCAQSGSAHHNEQLIPQIDALLKKAKIKITDVQKFGVVVGPGSFTGIRVGVATIKSFRDVSGAKAYSINNLQYLYSLAESQLKNFGAVAIAGSGNTYFVAKKIHNQIYYYTHNLTLKELLKVAENRGIAMFEEDKNIKAQVVKLDAQVLLKCLNESKDESLLPVYYQLSQAEREKLNIGKLSIVQTRQNHIEEICKIESEVQTASLTKNQILESFSNPNYKMFSALFNGEVVGFIILQITDEINVFNVAVKKEFRNIGIGGKLIKKAEYLSKKQGLNAVSLEVAYNNITAFLLYEKLGYTVRRIRKNYYPNGQDCLEMAKVIK